MHSVDALLIRHIKPLNVDRRVSLCSIVRPSVSCKRDRVAVNVSGGDCRNLGQDIWGIAKWGATGWRLEGRGVLLQVAHI